MDENAVFCPTCGAAQIKVTARPPENQDRPAAKNPESGWNPATGDFPAIAHPDGIHWGAFVRIASPLAALTGIVAWLFFPAVLIALPLSLRRTIVRYRPFHAGALTSGQGARLGAFMALLSFTAFMILFLPVILLNRAALITKIHETALQNPDPQIQQTMLWFATNTGLIVFIAFMLLFMFVIFLVIGLVGGALMTRNRP